MKRFYVIVFIIVLSKAEFVRTLPHPLIHETNGILSSTTHRIFEIVTDVGKNDETTEKQNQRSTKTWSTSQITKLNDVQVNISPTTQHPTICPSKSDDDIHKAKNKSTGGEVPNCKNSKEVVYISIIVILCLFIIGLLIFIYILKTKMIKFYYDEKVELKKADCTSKYTRQLSSESNEASFIRENNVDDSRFKLTRQGSNMSILEYTNHQDITKKKREEPFTSTNTLNKIIHHQPKQMQQDQIKEICKAVLLKSQNRSEYSSLTNLDKIVSEGKAKAPDKSIIIQKSASSEIVDTDGSKVLTTPLSVKKVINNFEGFPSPTKLNKAEKLKNAENKPQTIHKVNEKVEGTASLPSHFAAMNIVKIVDTETAVAQDDIYDNPPPRHRPVSLSESNDEHVDDIYVDPPNNRPVSLKDNDVHVDDVYDNPPNNRPVKNEDVNHIDDIYDDPTNNKSVINDVSLDKDNIYDDAQCGNSLTEKGSSSPQKHETKTGDVYDFPPPFNSRGITVTNDKDSQYSLTLTSSKESCFDSNYVNARTFNC